MTVVVKIFEKIAKIRGERAKMVVQIAEQNELERVVRLKEIGFNGRRRLDSFTKKEQKEIMILLPQTTSYLLELLEVVPRE